MSDSFSWPIFLALLGASWVASYVTLLIPNAAAAAGSGTTAVAVLAAIQALVAALVGAAVLPHILRAISELDVTFGNAAAALFLGSVVSSVVSHALLDTRPTGAGLFASLLPTLAGTAVAYFLLTTYATERRLATVSKPVAWVPPRDTAAGYETAIRETQLDVERLCDQVADAPPTELPSRVNEGLLTLEVRADRIAELTPPRPEAQPAQAKLVRGLRALADELVALARRAQTAHAARELEASSALRTIADALDELGQLGVLRSPV
jgi:hypothetical protein